MIKLRAIFAIARADFLERVRRYAFLVTLAATAWVGWLVVQGQVTLRLGRYAGVVNGAWAGALVAVTLSCLVSLVGFWIVKDTVARDRDTRVGEILAATPLTKAAYTSGKFLSNLAVLTTIVMALALAAPILVWLRGGSMDLVAMFGPFALIALPAMAVVAALAVLFETFRPLSGGVGNVLWFFVWTALLVVPLVTESPRADMTGLLVLEESMGEAAHRAHPDYTTGFTLSVGGGDSSPIDGTFVWDGLDWTPSKIASRLAWFPISLLVALAAAIPFDRFDGSGSSRRSLEQRPKSQGSGISVALPGFLPPVLAGELKLMLNGKRWWFWAVFLGLVIAEFATPLAIARGRILPAAWLWPVLMWSPIGAREGRDGTEELVFTAPHPLSRQLPAVYAAGVLVALVAGCGVGVRCLAGGLFSAFAAWLVGALFIPALALACGAWSHGSKLFEALYVVLWYLGPMQPVPALDFMGASDLTLAAGVPVYYALATAACLAAAVGGRRWSMAR